MVSMRGGFEFIDLLQGYERAIIVDCLEEPGTTPGTIRRLTPDKLAGSSRLTGMHGMSLKVALGRSSAAGTTTSRSLPRSKNCDSRETSIFSSLLVPQDGPRRLGKRSGMDDEGRPLAICSLGLVPDFFPLST